MTKKEIIKLSLELVDHCKNPYQDGIPVKRSMERVLEIETILKNELK